MPHGGGQGVSTAMGLGGEQPLKEGAVTLQALPKILGGDLLTTRPAGLKLVELTGEGAGQALHQVRDQCVSLLDGGSRLVHESGLNLAPAGDDGVPLPSIKELSTRPNVSAGARGCVGIRRYA